MVVTESKPNACYLTKGGYLVTLNSSLKAPINLSPGLNKDNKNSEKFGKGWQWKPNGCPNEGLESEWADKLAIIEELPFSIPEAPLNYQFAGGYPQFREPVNGEQFMGMYRPDIVTRDVCWSGVGILYGGRRIIVEPIGSPIGSPIDSPVSPPVEPTKPSDGIAMPTPFDLPVSLGPIHFDLEGLAALHKMENTKKMSILTTFIVDPYKNSVWAAKKAFPYAIFYSALAIAAYCVWEPSSAWSIFKACIPSISVELPTIIKD